MRIRIHRPLPDGVMEEDVTALLQSAECPETAEASDEAEEDDESMVPSEEAPATNGEVQPLAGDCLVVVIGTDTVADTTLGDAVSACVMRGGRVVGIWAIGIEEAELPIPLDTLGSGVCVWDPEQVREVINGRDDCWSQPDGTPRPAPVTARNLCR